MSEAENIATKEIGLQFGLIPRKDELFSARLSACLNEGYPIYFAAIPLALCVPYDLDYRPDLHRVGAAAIQDVTAKAQKGSFPQILVYQRGYWFVVSDGYIPYFSALSGMPDYVACFVLGEPRHPLIKDVQGPIDPASFRRMLGL